MKKANSEKINKLLPKSKPKNLWIVDFISTIQISEVNSFCETLN